MSIPSDLDIKSELLYLLSNAQNGTMHCNDVYEELSKSFPQLTNDEMKVPYCHSKSKWANSVQFVRLHCVLEGLIYRSNEASPRGFWTLTEKGLHFFG